MLNEHGFKKPHIPLELKIHGEHRASAHHAAPKRVSLAEADGTLNDDVSVEADLYTNLLCDDAANTH